MTNQSTKNLFFAAAAVTSVLSAFPAHAGERTVCDQGTNQCITYIDGNSALNHVSVMGVGAAAAGTGALIHSGTEAAFRSNLMRNADFEALRTRGDQARLTRRAPQMRFTGRLINNGANLQQLNASGTAAHVRSAGHAAKTTKAVKTAKTAKRLKTLKTIAGGAGVLTVVTATTGAEIPVVDFIEQNTVGYGRAVSRDNSFGQNAKNVGKHLVKANGKILHDLTIGNGKKIVKTIKKPKRIGKNLRNFGCGIASLIKACR